MQEMISKNVEVVNVLVRMICSMTVVCCEKAPFMHSFVSYNENPACI
jgi:hypothetical protein